MTGDAEPRAPTRSPAYPPSHLRSWRMAAASSAGGLHHVGRVDPTRVRRGKGEWTSGVLSCAGRVISKGAGARAASGEFAASPLISALEKSLAHPCAKSLRGPRPLRSTAAQPVVGVTMWFSGGLLSCRCRLCRNETARKAAVMTRILLAEDDDSLRAFLSRALERAGYEVRACADGDEAIDASERRRQVRCPSHRHRHARRRRHRGGA